MTLDKLEIEIDNLCYEVLALEQPVARDLRFIATALKIVRDSNASAISLSTSPSVRVELIQEPELKRLVDLPIMAEAAQQDSEREPGRIREFGCGTGGEGHS